MILKIYVMYCTLAVQYTEYMLQFVTYYILFFLKKGHKIYKIRVELMTPMDHAANKCHCTNIDPWNITFLENFFIFIDSV